MHGSGGDAVALKEVLNLNLKEELPETLLMMTNDKRGYQKMDAGFVRCCSHGRLRMSSVGELLLFPFAPGAEEFLWVVPDL